MARQAHGDPLFAIHRKTIDRGVVHLVVFRLAGITQQLSDLLCGDILLGDYELHKHAPEIGRLSSGTVYRFKEYLRRYPCS